MALIIIGGGDNYMNLILTMAGLCSRFKKEGYKIPKYLLPWGSKSILGEILTELNKDRDFQHIYLIGNTRDEVFMPHVREIMKSIGIVNDNLILISDTKGQAETAFRAVNAIQDHASRISGPIVFHNIDTILYNRDFKRLPELLKKYNGYIDIFKSNNHNYSYVLETNDIVDSIVEKVVVSDKATSGFYGFSSAELFIEYYQPNDMYISTIFQRMIENGNKIVISQISTEEETVVLGTPSEYVSAAYLLDLR